MVVSDGAEVGTWVNRLQPESMSTVEKTMAVVK